MEDKGTSMATGLAERRFWAVVARLGGALVLVLVPVVLVLAWPRGGPGLPSTRARRGQRLRRWTAPGGRL
jgi:hypothetical protein